MFIISIHFKHKMPTDFIDSVLGFGPDHGSDAVFGTSVSPGSTRHKNCPCPLCVEPKEPKKPKTAVEMPAEIPLPRITDNARQKEHKTNREGNKLSYKSSLRDEDLLEVIFDGSPMILALDDKILNHYNCNYNNLSRKNNEKNDGWECRQS